MRVRVRKYYLIIAAFCIFSLGIFLRFYQLGYVPKGLYPDETAIGYNAYSILYTGKDEYGKFLPLYFRSFDDYKLPVYIYATSLAIKIFGVSPLSVRLPSAILGSITIIAVYFLVLKLSRSKAFALIAAFFLAVNPWHTFFSRTGYEVNVAVSLMLIGTFFLINGVDHKIKHINIQIGLSLISFLLAVYTYNVTRILSPFIFLALLFYYMVREKKINRKTFVFICSLFFIGMVPIITTSVSLQAEPGFSSQKDALIIGNEIKAEILQTKSYFVALPLLIQKLFFNYYVLVFWTYLKNTISFFSTNFFFITGSDKPSQNIGGGLAMFYYFEFPLIIFGLYKAIKQKAAFIYPFIIWFIVIFLVGTTVKIVPNGTRTYPVVIPLTIFSAYGMYSIIQILASLKNEILKKSAYLLIPFIILYYVILYYISYFIRYPIEYAKDWRSEDQKTVEYIMSVEKKYDKVIFDDSAEFFYTSLLFYGKYMPGTYQQNAKYQMKGLVNTLIQVGKFEFRKVDWENELFVPETLFVTGERHVPQGEEPLAIFSYPVRPVVLYYDRKIAQFPTTDVAYVLLESARHK